MAFMAGLADKLFSSMEITDDGDFYDGYDDYDMEDDDEVYEEEKRGGFFSSMRGNDKPEKDYEVVNRGKITNMKRKNSGFDSAKIQVLQPVDMNNSQEIADLLLNGSAVCLNFQGCDTSQAQRITDFVAGTVYAINGTLYNINDQIIMAAPPLFDITGNIENVLDDHMSNRRYSFN